MESKGTDIREIIRLVHSQAEKIGLCGMFTGEETTLEELMRLYTSPQGIEFCAGNHFPNISVMRMVRGMGTERYGVYIDAGDITVTDAATVCLVGRTTARVVCGGDRPTAHRVALLHGARAVVDARGWAVVSVTAEKGCQVVRNLSGQAVMV